MKGNIIIFSVIVVTLLIGFTLMLKNKKEQANNNLIHHVHHDHHSHDGHDHH